MAGAPAPYAPAEPLPYPLPQGLATEEARDMWRTGSGRLSKRGSMIEAIKTDDGRGEGVSTLDYMISLMGYAIGIGNLWRFPYLVGKYGGFSFLLVYVFSLIMVACPMYLFELAIGQDTRKSTIHCMRAIRPRWSGVGWATCFTLFYVLAYYNMLLAYSIVYMFNSFTWPLPWTPEALPPNMLPEGRGPSEHFWLKSVLDRFDPDEFNAGNTSGLGPVQWHLVGTLLLVWILVFFALFKGMEASAKVSYVTVGLPVILMLVMLFRTVMLDGAGDGIEFYIAKFDPEVFKEIEMWSIACGQILFSLSPGMGTAITLSSYTRPKEDVYKVNLLVSLCNSSFSITGGFAVFSILGFMSYQSCNIPGRTCTPVGELAAGGTGLAFVTLAEGVAQFGDGSNVFALFFFIMLLTLGLDSTFAWTESFNTYIHDHVVEAGLGQKEMVVHISTRGGPLGLEVNDICQIKEVSGAAAQVGVPTKPAWGGKGPDGPKCKVLSVGGTAVKTKDEFDAAIIKAGRQGGDFSLVYGIPVRWFQREWIAFYTAFVLFLSGIPFCTSVGIFLLDQVDHFVASYVLIIVCFVELVMLHVDWGWATVVCALKRATKGPQFPEGRHIPACWGIILTYITPFIIAFLGIYLLYSDLNEVYGGYPAEMQVLGWVTLLSCILPIPVCFVLNWGMVGDPNAGSRPHMKGKVIENPENFEYEQPLLHTGTTTARPPPPTGAAAAIEMQERPTAASPVLSPTNYAPPVVSPTGQPQPAAGQSLL